MPAYIGPRHDRRDFLKFTALGAGALMTGACARLPFRRVPTGKPAHLALLSDTHVSQDPNEKNKQFHINENTKRAVAEAVAAAPEGAIISGDLARLEGRDGDYRMLRELLEPMHARMPIALCLGNHDDRKLFRKHFTSHPGQPGPIANKHLLVIDHEPAGVRIICLDSLLYVNRTAGFLGKPQRRWLAETLDASPRTPTLLFLHHTFGEGEGQLLDTDEFFRTVEPRRQVKAVVYGHSHEYNYTQADKGLHLINVPAVAYSFDEKEPIGWVEASLTNQGGDFTLRAIGSNMGENGKTTSLEWR